MPRRFHPEIQALRALAVLLVVVYHLQPTALPGGFIGVDVFFVISGYLITGHLLREVQETGRIRLGAFWAARVRRILPAGLLCIAVTLLACLAIYPITQWARVGWQGFASALSGVNWLLAAQSVDYLGATEAATPFQHFWSLSVEEQFYLVWPVLVLAGALLAARRGLRHAPGLLLGIVVVASLALSVWRVAAGDATAYFTTTTRVWELGCGGLLALWLPRIRVGEPLRTPLAWGGVAVIVAAAVLIGPDAPFPGALALVPVLGAVSVIAAGQTTGRFAPAAAFAWRPVQWVGDASYSLYLWHFPPIVLFTVATGRAPGALAAVLIAAGALAAAGLSRRFVEQPVRTSPWLQLRSMRALSFGAASVAVICVVALALPWSEARAEQRWVATAAALDAAGPQGAAAMTRTADRFFVGGETGVTPSPTRAGSDEPTVLHAGCTGVPMSSVTPVCHGGDPHGTVHVALVGDSHAKELTTAIFAIAQERGWRVDTYLHASCPFNIERRAVEARGGSVCAGPNAATMSALLADPPDMVVLADWASGDFVDTGTGRPPGVAGYASVWNRLADAGSEVVVFKDVPRPLTSPLSSDCVARHYDDPEQCGMPRDQALQGRDIVLQAQALAPRTRIVDLTDRLCGATECPAVIGNVLVYRDTNHVTDTFMRTLTPYIDERLPSPASARPASARR